MLREDEALAESKDLSCTQVTLRVDAGRSGSFDSVRPGLRAERTAQDDRLTLETPGRPTAQTPPLRFVAHSEMRPANRATDR